MIPEDSILVWKIDDVAFSDFGVGVAKSSGVLDMPSIIDTSIDWMDENGKDYWQGAEDVKYQAREISLNCWVRATGYEQFKTRVAAFYSALVCPGERTLTTPFGNSIEHVTVQQSIQMVRKTAYVKSLQVGMFTLRLTVAGDSETKLMTVYRADGVILGMIPYGSDARLIRSLMNNSEITWSTDFNSIQTLGNGDYVICEGERYISLGFPVIDKFSTNKFVYRLLFTHQFFVLKDIQFRVIDQSDTFWWATMEDIIDCMITNANRGHDGLFMKGDIETTEYRNHQFQNESCYDVMSRTVSEYGLEYEYVWNSLLNKIQINIKQQVGLDTGITLKYGKDNSLHKINRVSPPREGHVTRLYAYGSDKNIPASYGYPRLKLPVEPITRDFWGIHIERTKVWNDIFPERTGTVTGYVKKIKADTWVYAPGTYPGPHPIKIYTSYPEDNTYELTDTAMDFDLKEKDVAGNTKYLIAGSTAKIHFNSGDLAGFAFEVLDYNHATKTFKLIPYTDSQGMKYPTEVLYPKPGDKYKILDINPPEIDIEIATAKLQAVADAWIDKGYNPPGIYSVESLPTYTLGGITPGSTMTLEDDDFGVNDSMRITEITTNLYQGGSTLTLAEYTTQSKRKELTDKVEAIERSIVNSKLDEVSTIRGNEKTTAEVINMLIDPADGKLKAIDVIRPKSIDPVMLAPDSGIPQFSVKDAQVEVNVDDNPNKIRINVGTFLSHNFYAVDRRTIGHIKEDTE